MGEWRLLLEVVILGTVDQAFEVFRQNAAIGWMMLTAVEGVARSGRGVGVLLFDQNKFLNLAEIFAIQISILAIGILIDYIIGVSRNLACPWRIR